jgi:very-short-patch-repair endonuclease
MDKRPKRVRDEEARNRAREARQHPSVAEKIAWRILRDRCLGFKFRREHNIGRYRVDFYCAEARLAVEFDGEQHDPTRDKLRDEAIKAEGVEVMRIPNRDFFMLNPVPPDDSFNRILAECERRTGRKGTRFEV